MVSAQDYFAYGELLREVNSVDRYKYTEKERDKETEYDYFGARYYDSELGRWLTVDPLADNYLAWSPYNYSICNPINLIDKFGKYAVRPTPALYPWYELPEITVIGYRDYFTFSAEESSFLATLGVIAIAEPTPGGEILWGIVAGGLIGAKIFDDIFSGSDDARLLMNEVKESDKSETEQSNESAQQEEKTVKEVLKGKKASIKNAPLGKGAPSWDEIQNKTMKEINDRAKRNLPGYKTIKKLLGNKRFDK